MNAAANLTVIDRPDAALDTPEKTILVLAHEEKGALHLRFEPEVIIFKAPAGAARKLTATIRAADGIKLAFDSYQIADPSTVVKSDISRDGQTMTIHFAFPNLFLLQGLNYFFKGSLPPRDGTDESTPVLTVYEGDPQVGNDPPTNQESRLLTRPVTG
jgi:hypothetical protein